MAETEAPAQGPGTLIGAVRDGDAARVRELLSAGAGVSGRDDDDWCALDWAAGRGDEAMIRLLLEHGADPAAAGREQRRPHDIALAAGHLPAARLLREAAGSADPAGPADHAWRPYCRAYQLSQLSRYPQWPADAAARAVTEDAGSGDADEEDPVVFLHDDLTVSASMWPGEDVLFDAVTPQWAAFCAAELGFQVPDEMDLVPPGTPPAPGGSAGSG
jgi:ankyrin repeat protein